MIHKMTARNMIIQPSINPSATRVKTKWATLVMYDTIRHETSHSACANLPMQGMAERWFSE